MTNSDRISTFLCLAATPIFAVMALMAGSLDAEPMSFLCAAGHGSPLGGMAPMYWLMSAFHAVPWLTLISSRRSGRAESRHTCHSRRSTARH